MIHFMNLNRVFQKGKSIFDYKINLNFTSAFFILVMILSTYNISYYVITKNNQAIIPNKAVSGKDVPKTPHENFTEPIDNGKYDQFIPYRVRNGERKFHHIISQAAALSRTNKGYHFSRVRLQPWGNFQKRCKGAYAVDA